MSVLRARSHPRPRFEPDIWTDSVAAGMNSHCSPGNREGILRITPPPRLEALKPNLPAAAVLLVSDSYARKRNAHGIERSDQIPPSFLTAADTYTTDV